jgi:gliding motility-associated-like protein
MVVFWETERRFDGANLQYSTDLGGTWINVGTVSDPVNCLNDNWFNFSPITGLNSLATVRDGWSGTIQPTAGSCQGTGGSGRWVNAQHTMPGLAGAPNVIFRFTFGAGTVCNNFDGFAVDDIRIGEALPNNASFTYSCVNNTTVNFTNTSALCPATNWDFGDPTSGTNNTSTAANPTHIFSAPGTYTITLIASGPDNAADTTTETINILGLTTSVIANNNCFGDNNGTASVSVIPATAAPFFYLWNSTPAQNTATATSLPAGTFTVTVSGLNSCQATASAIITQPAAITQTLSIVQPGCGATTGTATATVSGGTPPYAYLWQPFGGTTATATGLTPGNYTVNITDSRLCTATANAVIAVASPPALSITNIKNVSCFGLRDGSASALASGGNAPYSYSWNTNPVQTGATATNLPAGNYTVTVTDNNGCIVSASVDITQPASGACGDVYFPNSFTPNGDSRNDGFGPVGNLPAISNYRLYIYNRYGELVFTSKDPLEKWNGYYKAKLNSPGSYAWYVSYTFKNRFQRNEQGTVMVIR